MTVQQKQKLKAHLAMVKLSDPVYNALNEAFVFNLSLEASVLYDLCHFVDQDAANDSLTSQKLRDHVLYLETGSKRYELARFVESGSTYRQMYRLAVVRDAHLKDNQFYSGLK